MSFFHLTTGGVVAFMEWAILPHSKPATGWLGDFSHEVWLAPYRPEGNWPVGAKRVGDLWVKAEPWLVSLLADLIEPLCKVAVATNESRNRPRSGLEYGKTPELKLSLWSGNNHEGINRNLANFVSQMIGHYPTHRKEAMRVLAESHRGDTRGKMRFEQPAGSVGRKPGSNVRKINRRNRWRLK